MHRSACITNNNTSSFNSSKGSISAHSRSNWFTTNGSRPSPWCSRPWSLVQDQPQRYISYTRKDLKLTLEQERMLQAIIGALTTTSRTAAWTLIGCLTTASSINLLPKEASLAYSRGAETAIGTRTDTRSINESAHSCSIAARSRIGFLIKIDAGRGNGFASDDGFE